MCVCVFVLFCFVLFCLFQFMKGNANCVKLAKLNNKKNSLSFLCFFLFSIHEGKRELPKA